MAKPTERELAEILYLIDHPDAVAVALLPTSEELEEGNYLVKARDVLARGEEGRYMAEWDKIERQLAEQEVREAEELEAERVKREEAEVKEFVRLLKQHREERIRKKALELYLEDLAKEGGEKVIDTSDEFLRKKSYWEKAEGLVG